VEARLKGSAPALMDGNEIDHLDRYRPTYRSVYEEVQYEAQVNHLRHSRFAALRDDKDASEVRKETSEATSS
jgi:hypothetical protein